ncbi:MAG TPA: enoyl-CoA hydratase/isomerase family protein [Solirubrobacteraceae bacterium]|nr:enoyl-CoA hydratase/isomerase family protein [Solirubrobacteraceae bacterium]
MSDESIVRVERDTDRRVATITLDNPDKHNRVPMAARAELAEVFGSLSADEQIRVIVITGAGERAFSAGGDVMGFLRTDPATLSRLAWNVAAPERCRKPVIAKLRGYVLGVGLELALASDFRIAADNAEMGLPEIRLGMIPGSGGTQRMARMIGMGRAKNLIMRGQRIDAQTALDYGLVSEVHPADALDGAVDAVIDELLALSPLALSMAKRVLDHAYDGPLGIGLELEGMAYGLLRSSHDFDEGVRAFVEKRPAKFEGR